MTAPFWSEHIFVLVTPDTLVRGLAGRVVARLRRDHFEPVVASLVQADSDMIDEMYADVLAGQWQTWRYRLIDDLFALGPCLAVVCRYPADADPHEVMRAAKGHQHPHLQQPGTIRWDFAAINSILGVLHASDNPKESQKDAHIFGVDGCATEPPEAPLDGDQVDLLCELTVPQVPETRGYAAVLAGVRARILLEAWPQLGNAVRGRLRAQLQGVTDLGAPDAAQRLGTLLAGALTPATLEILTCPFTPQWRDGRRVSSLFDTLHQAGVRLDAWERLVLETSLYFPATRRPPTDLH